MCIIIIILLRLRFVSQLIDRSVILCYGKSFLILSASSCLASMLFNLLSSLISSSFTTGHTALPVKTKITAHASLSDSQPNQWCSLNTIWYAMQSTCTGTMTGNQLNFRLLHEIKTQYYNENRETDKRSS